MTDDFEDWEARALELFRRADAIGAVLWLDPPVRVAKGVGILDASIDVEISSGDLSIAAESMGGRSYPLAPHRRAGSGPLWREWSGEDVPSSPHEFPTLKLRPGAPVEPEPPPPPEPWTVRSLPDGNPLGRRGWKGHGGTPPDSLYGRHTFRFELPPPDATGIELSLDDLVVFRTCGDQIVTVPAPSLDETVDLAGRSLSCGSQSVELLRWEPPNYSTATPRLLVRAPPRSWPDVRVLVGDRSVTLWMRRTVEGTLQGGLPGMYLSAFTGSDVLPLGLRMLGNPLKLDPIAIMLGPPGP